MNPKNPHAVALGKLARGKPKTLTQAERKRKAKLMRIVQRDRVAGLRKAKAKATTP